MSDSTGTFPILFTIALIVGLVVGGIWGGVAAHNNGATGWGVVAGVLMGAGVGLMIAGVAIATGGAALVKAGIIVGISFEATVALGFAAWAIGAVTLSLGAGVNGQIINVEGRVQPNVLGLKQQKDALSLYEFAYPKRNEGRFPYYVYY